MSPRIVAFISVGVLGFVIQIAALALLSAADWPLAAATAVAVELAVLHNFLWHQHWTWRDRTGESWLARLVRFQGATGLTSVLSNVVLTTTLAHVFTLNAVVANTCAVVVTSLANFVLADRVVFGSAAERPGVPRAPRHQRASNSTGLMNGAKGTRARRRALRTVGTVCFFACALAARSADAAPGRHTVEAWNDYVSDAEANMAVSHTTPCDPVREPQGHTQGVPGGTIHRWRGCTVVPNFTVDALLDALRYPGTPPPQEDILESRVMARSPDVLRVYLKLRRRAVLTVTYDTEHEVTFRRHSERVATSRSVATSIVEEGGGDRGFLWRLNSYWRYAQVGPDVRIELESLSLSRAVPVLLRPVASPIVSSVARESVARALEAVRHYKGSHGRQSGMVGDGCR